MRRVLAVFVVVELVALVVVGSLVAGSAPGRWRVDGRTFARGMVTGGDLVVPWRFGMHGPGDYAPVLSIDRSAYPNAAGVTFWVVPAGGVAVADRTDLRGPELHGDEFHARRRVWAAGDRVKAEWVDRDGRAWVAWGLA